MNIMNTVVLEDDPISGEIILPLTNEMLSVLNCKENDTVNIVDNEDGSFTITKATDDITSPSDEWDDNQWNMFTKWLRNSLQTTCVSVIFTKKDGSERVMQCTLNPNVLPKQIDLEESIQKKTPNPDVMAVWDITANGWRSFTIRSVKRVLFTIE